MENNIMEQSIISEATIGMRRHTSQEEKDQEFRIEEEAEALFMVEEIEAV